MKPVFISILNFATKQTLLIYLIASLFFCGCKKSDNTIQLPPATHSGADVIGCKINNQVYVFAGAGQKFSQGGTGVIYYLVYDSVFSCSGVTLDPHFNIELNCTFNPVLSTQVLHPNSTSAWGASFSFFNGTTLVDNSNTFYTDSLHNGTITFTYYNGTIIAGTFEFDAINGNDSVIHVTEGRFDIENHY